VALKGIIDRIGGVFWALCLGAIGLFAFFAAIGSFTPGDAPWVTAAVAVLAAAFTVHAVQVSQVLRGSRAGETMRALNRLRERRGF
jgi:peptidoglycan/LPS O-acetylase OafA/YrhL